MTIARTPGHLVPIAGEPPRTVLSPLIIRLLLLLLFALRTSPALRVPIYVYTSNTETRWSVEASRSRGFADATRTPAYDGTRLRFSNVGVMLPKETDLGTTIFCLLGPPTRRPFPLWPARLRSPLCQCFLPGGTVCDSEIDSPRSPRPLGNGPLLPFLLS